MLKEAIDTAAMLREFPRMLDRIETAERRIAEIERKLQLEPCPSCKLPMLKLIQSEPDKTFGVVGDNRRTYRCLSCNFEESRLEAF